MVLWVFFFYKSSFTIKHLVLFFAVFWLQFILVFLGTVFVRMTPKSHADINSAYNLHSYYPPSHFTNRIPEFVAVILRQKIALVWWQNERGRRDDEFWGSGRKDDEKEMRQFLLCSPRQGHKLHTHTHTPRHKSCHTWHHKAWRTIRSW